jgi:hypothetical protein
MCQTQFAPSPVLPAYANWKTAATPLSSLSNEQLKGFTITPDTIQNVISSLKEIKTRWLVEMIPQILRAQNRPDGNGKAILVLGMCRKGDCLWGNFEQPESQVEKILSALEVPGGPSVVLFDLRQDCIRYRKKQDGKAKEYCLPFMKDEVTRCLELVIQEINMAVNIFGLEFESIFSFSTA